MTTRTPSTTTTALSFSALAGCVIVILADFSMWFIVDGYNPLRGSISDLGAGPHHMIQDIGIAAYALAILCLVGITFTHRNPDESPWLLRTALLGLSIAIILIAFWNEYGDGQPGGLEIHNYLLMALYLCVAIIIWLSKNLSLNRQIGGGVLSTGILIVWLIAAPSLLLMPDSIYGAYERILALVMIGVVAVNAWSFVRQERTLAG